MNKVFLVGALGADPEMRSTHGGTQVCAMRLATSETRGRGDDAKEKTEWHSIVAWDKKAEWCGQNLRKGSRVFIEGRLQTRKWQDKDGNDRYTTEVIVETIFGTGESNAPPSRGFAHDAGERKAPVVTKKPVSAAQQGRFGAVTAPPATGAFSDDIPF